MGGDNMSFEMQKALLLAENIHEFIKFVNSCYEGRSKIILNKDKLYQIKLFIEEFKFHILADELHRINQFEWDGRYTHLLVDRFIEGMNVIDEYTKRNYDDLFMISARIYTLMNVSSSFTRDDQ
jgi:hypothetical protein